MNKVIVIFLILAVAFYVAMPLLLPVAMGGLFAMVLYPWQTKFEGKKFKPALVAAVLTVGMTLILLVPASFLIFLGTKAAVLQIRELKGTPQIMAFPEKILMKMSQWFSTDPKEVIGQLNDFAQAAGLKIADWLGEGLSRLPIAVVGGGFLILSMFYFLMDGRKLVFFFRRNSVFTPAQTEKLLVSFTAICRSVILASLLVGLVQSLIFSVGSIVMGVSNPSLIGFSVFVCSFVPVVGSAPITFGIALHQFFTESHGAGIFLGVLATITSLLDNIIRAWVLKGAGNLHPLFAFVAVIGGLQTLGFAGIFLGPVLVGFAVTTIRVISES